MANRHNPKLRFGMTLREAEDSSFQPSLANAPPLPAVNYGLVGKPAPSLLPTQSGSLPKASAVVITWASAEWAALEHVFCAGGSDDALQREVARDLGRLGAIFRQPAVRPAVRLELLGLLPDGGNQRRGGAALQVEHPFGLARRDVPDRPDQADHRRREAWPDPVHRHGWRHEAAGPYRHGEGGQRRDAVREQKAGVELAGIQERMDGERRDLGERQLQAASVPRADEGQRPGDAVLAIQSAIP